MRRDLPTTIYFDTCVFSYFATAFREFPIDEDLRDHFAISPISLLELLGRLAVADAKEETFTAVHTILKVFNPTKISILPWVDEAIRVCVFDLPQAPSEIISLLADVTHDVLRANSLDALNHKWDPLELRRHVEDAKNDAATRYSELLDSFRRGEHKEAFANRIALRAGFSLECMKVDEVTSRLCALWMYLSAKLDKDAANKNFNPFSRVHKNDAFDAEQLVYLANPDYHFLTSDRKGFKHLAGTKQNSRIHFEPLETFKNPIEAAKLIRRIVTGSGSTR